MPSKSEQAMNKSRAENPIDLFRDWLAEAEKKEINEPASVALATADSSGAPSVRMVLVRGLDERGFVFYTNMESRKAVELEANPRAALCFHWKSLRRQVRVEGPVERVSDADADAYFASRDRAARIGAWASDQSRPLKGRLDLEKRVARFTAKYGLGEIPRPPHWSGYRVRPVAIEFWQQRPFRLHDRVLYQLRDGTWTRQKLFP